MQSVDVYCKVKPPSTIQSAYPDGYWYKIASDPWNGAYYAVANTFWNGDIPAKSLTRTTPTSMFQTADKGGVAEAEDAVGFAHHVADLAVEGQAAGTAGPRPGSSEGEEAATTAPPPSLAARDHRQS